MAHGDFSCNKNHFLPIKKKPPRATLVKGTTHSTILHKEKRAMFNAIKKFFSGLSGDSTRPISPIDEIEEEEITLKNGDAMWHIEAARRAKCNGDFLGARMGYLKCVETLKQARANDDLEKATVEYDSFVRSDPFFKKIVSLLLPIIESNPGILQSEITKKAQSMDWAELYRDKRPLAKEDLYYALYFADKFGKIIRTKRGRSYELRIPD